MSQLCLQPTQLDPEDGGIYSPEILVPTLVQKYVVPHTIRSQSESSQRSHVKFWIQDL